ncbi:MAG: hypothetical protein AB4426_08830 [Xenococcaceae cyanobacterium]
MTNGAYTIDQSAMSPHLTGSLSAGKSQFLFWVDAFSVVLDAAAYADEYELWEVVGEFRAKITVVNGPVGVVAETGELTHYLNIYRTRTRSVDGRLTRFAHGSPGNPP